MKKLLIIFLLLTSGCMFLSEEENIAYINEDIHFMYAKEQLSKSQQKDYDTLFNAIMNHDENTYVNVKKKDDLINIYQCILYDHPEIFYIEKVSWKKSDQKDRGNLIVYPIYEYSQKEIQEKQNAIDQEVKPILDATSTMDDTYEKVRYVYDYIVDKVTYKEDSKDNQNILSVFLNDESVCAGYAKSFQYILNELGIPCAYITGNSLLEPKQPHAWNMALIDGSYYYFDTTFADTFNEQNIHDLRYAFFAMNSLDIKQIYTDIYSYEQGSDITYSYFARHNAYFNEYDESRIDTLVEESIKNGTSCLMIKTDNSQTFDSIHNNLIEERHIFDTLYNLGFNKSSIQFYQLEELNILIYLY